MNPELKELVSKVKELRPYIVKKLQDESIEAYKKCYSDNHKGKLPNETKINEFIQQLIAKGQIVEQANAIIKELIEDIEKTIAKESKKKKYKIVVRDITILLLELSLVLSYIILFLNEKFKIEIIKKDILLNDYTCFQAIVVVILLVGSYFGKLFSSKQE